MYKQIFVLFCFFSIFFTYSSQATISLTKKDGINSESVKVVKITFVGIVGEKSIMELISTINEINTFYPSLDRIFLYIHSPGGDMHSGYMAYEEIKSSATPVTTINAAYVASAATLFYCAGKERQALPLAHFTLHPASTSAQGSLQPDNLEQLKQSVEGSNNIFRHIYQKCTNYSKEEINSMLYSEDNHKELNISDAINRKMVTGAANSIINTPVSYYILSDDNG